MTAVQPGDNRSEPVETPVLTVVRGHPTVEELAALTAVVLALQPAEAAAPVRSPARHWVRREHLRLGPKPGPGAWRRSRG
ncbi:acyl-CoA carboxylase subunit epsilon [Paenarthrobacter sp. Z7-10]|uniref:acyl-CoA carboxylase subunit epsilon n=1 Tax=Paenarthrobacter sp. Z7-10 TaxID=2787635 RepID=UPI0022A9D0C7|nr:acyl-CoA carboxylase subunit epsilon [Paenarthrobacter sp. Z7-10]MCZ2402907.1 acyl-CoA carboxylase subunit epsilon [Paenarthrobacter sp. Z7-10]